MTMPSSHTAAVDRDTEPSEADQQAIATPETPAHEPRLAAVPKGADLDLHDGSVRSFVEDELTSLPSVLAARIVPGFERAIDELHVITTPSKSVKATVRDVQSFLMARFDVTTDHRVISVAQIDTDASAIISGRVVISEVTVKQRDLVVDVTVSLTDGQQVFEATEQGLASVDGRTRAVARATLSAARPLLGEGRETEIEGVALDNVLGRTVAITFVHFHSYKGQSTMCGSSMSRGDESAAVARSVLDAINRELNSR